MQKSVLILGASGRFGRNAADAFWNAGWSIRTFDRRRDDLNEAARGADVIVAAWNPAYPDWAAEIPALHARIQDAARLSGAMVLIPGNVYVYGAQTPAPWREDTPHNATNPLGELRIGMEQSYRDSGVQTVILRAGDFIDTEASGNWLDRMMLPSLPKDKFTYPGQPDIPHAWAYLPDLTRAAAEIAGQKESLPGFTDVTFPGYTLTGLEMTDMLTAVTGRSIALRRMSWLPLHLASAGLAAGALAVGNALPVGHAALAGKRPVRRALPAFRRHPAAGGAGHGGGAVAQTGAGALPHSLDAQVDPDHPVTAGRAGGVGQRRALGRPEYT